MLFSLLELLDILITVVAAGYIFMDSLEPIRGYVTFAERLMLAAAIVAPAIVLHEFGHKFVALGFGYEATFHAAYGWLAFGIILKLVSFPLLFVVPAYVSIAGASPANAAWIAFAGPAVNGLLFLGCWIALKAKKWDTTTMSLLYFAKTINLFLFIFNLIPIPGFDGWTFWMNIFG